MWFRRSGGFVCLECERMMCEVLFIVVEFKFEVGVEGGCLEWVWK